MVAVSKVGEVAGLVAPAVSKADVDDIKSQLI